MTLTWLDPERLALLRCPKTGGALTVEGDALVTADGARRWPSRHGLACLYEDEQVVGNDRLMRTIYNSLPALHDPATRVLTPIMQGISEHGIRRGFLPRLELERLSPRSDRPIRILEVGIGGGANLPYLQRALPPGLPVEIWGVDLSHGMLKQCQRRLERQSLPPTCLMMVDAHELPFVDGAFDRVFHVGAIGNYSHPDRALAEMARVAQPGSPIVVVDEELDLSQRQSLYHRLWFKALTFYDDQPHAPVAALPPSAQDIRLTHLSRFYYCMSFRVPV